MRLCPQRIVQLPYVRPPACTSALVALASRPVVPNGAGLQCPPPYDRWHSPMLAHVGSCTAFSRAAPGLGRRAHRGLGPAPRAASARRSDRAPAVQRPFRVGVAAHELGEDRERRGRRRIIPDFAKHAQLVGPSLLLAREFKHERHQGARAPVGMTEGVLNRFRSEWLRHAGSIGREARSPRSRGL